MGFPILVRWHLNIESGPRTLFSKCLLAIGTSDNGSTHYRMPGSLHTLGTGDQRDCLFIWIKILCIEYILWRILWAFKHTGLFIFYVLEQALHRISMVSCKYWVVPLISTRVSGYSQVILLFHLKVGQQDLSFRNCPQGNIPNTTTVETYLILGFVNWFFNHKKYQIYTSFVLLFSV